MDGIILAGGKSTRMKQNKLLLLYKEKPILFYTIESMAPFVDNIIVVTGKYDKEIREALKDKNVKIITNSDYEKGMFSSVQTGVKHVGSDFFLIPGDCPFVQKETYLSLLKGKGKIRVPRYQNKDGHPIYISYEYKEEILSLPLDYNLKLFRDLKKYEIIEVEDKNIILNLNTVLDIENIN